MIWKAICIFPLVLGCIYFLFLTFLFLGFFKIKKTDKSGNYKPAFVSVIVAARNEEDNIISCLNSLLEQTYSKELYEIIIVDDNSTDKTFSIVESIARKHNNVKLLKTSDNSKVTGKQRALDTGIRTSKGVFILTIDADCQAQPTWIEGIVKAYEPDVGLVAGYSIFKWNKDKGFLKKVFYNLQHLDQLSLYAVSVGSISQGIAWTCTGNNLSYRRQLYDELGGFEALGMTGLEDNILIQWAGRHSNWKIKALPSSIVYTKPMSTVSKFFAQRKRWSSSNTQYRLSLVAFMVLTYLLYMFIPFMICLTLFGVIAYKILLIFLGLKVIPEFLLVSMALNLFHKQSLLKYFLLLQPIHLVYVLICGIFGLSNSFIWKGRKYGTMGQ